MEGVSADTPASQTLIALPLELETMVLPSGEKATEAEKAFCFSALRSRDAAAGRGAVSFWLRVQWYQPRGTCIPDFERLVVRVRAGHDALAVGREGHEFRAVRALFLRLELQGCCRKHRRGQVWAKGFGGCQCADAPAASLDPLQPIARCACTNSMQVVGDKKGLDRSNSPQHYRGRQ